MLIYKEIILKHNPSYKVEFRDVGVTKSTQTIYAFCLINNLMRVLFTTPIMEFPKRRTQLRIENSIKALSSMCDLTVAYRSLDQNIKSYNLALSSCKFKFINLYIHPKFFHRA